MQNVKISKKLTMHIARHSFGNISGDKYLLTLQVHRFKVPPIISKITARTNDFPLSNSMAESTHSIYKTEFLKGQHTRNREQHLKCLVTFVNYYNHHRFPTDLFGLTPFEVINGKFLISISLKHKLQKLN